MVSDCSVARAFRLDHFCMNFGDVRRRPSQAVVDRKTPPFHSVESEFLVHDGDSMRDGNQSVNASLSLKAPRPPQLSVCVTDGIFDVPPREPQFVDLALDLVEQQMQR